MSSEAFSVIYPEGTPDWESALRRISCLSGPQIIDAANLVLVMWGDSGEPLGEVEDLSAQHYLLEEMKRFMGEYDADPDLTGISFTALPDAFEGDRDALRSAVFVLGRLGVLQIAGFEVKADFAPFAVWPEGESDPAFQIPASL